MTAANQWAIVAVLMMLAALFFAGLAQWCARRALRMAKAAAQYQQQAGELAPDALRWRLHVADCARGGKTRAETQRAPIRAMTERLRREARG